LSAHERITFQSAAVEFVTLVVAGVVDVDEMGEAVPLIVKTAP
jgi:hypothetical protein